MKAKIYLIFLFLSVIIISCQKTSKTEVQPFANNFTDSTKVLIVDTQYPCMKLVTEDATPLIVGKAPVPVNIWENENPFAAAKEAEKQKNPLKTTIHYLPLETTEECLIGGIDKLESDDSSIFVFDQTNNLVFRFSQKDGSLLAKFGSKGRGPGEYTRLTDMSLNRDKKEVCLLDQGYKLMYFNYEGSLLREEPLYYFYSKLEFLGDCMILNTNYSENIKVPSINNNRLVLAQQNQTPSHVAFSFAREFAQKFNYDVRHPFITCNGNVYYNHVLSDTIWQIREDGTCHAKYVFKFPDRDNLFNEKDFHNITDDEYAEKIKKVPHYLSSTCILTRNFVYAVISNGDPLLYCIPTGQYVYGYPKYRSFGTDDTMPVTLSLNDSSFVRVLQPFEIIKEVQARLAGLNDAQQEYFKKNQLTEEERQLLTNMTEEDNPVLMIMDIEPF